MQVFVDWILIATAIFIMFVGLRVTLVPHHNPSSVVMSFMLAIMLLLLGLSGLLKISNPQMSRVLSISARITGIFTALFSIWFFFHS
jgi:hypothetical protein